MNIVTTQRQTKPRVLIVEDDEDLLEDLNEVFHDDGFQVSVATDGQRAASLLDSEAFDAVVCDMVLPNRNGLQLAQIARSNQLNAQAKFFLYSGFFGQFPVVQEDIEALSLTAVIAKPMLAQDLVNQVRRHLPLTTLGQSYDPLVIKTCLQAIRLTLEEWTGEPLSLGRPFLKPQLHGFGPASGLIPISQGQTKGSLSLSCPHNFFELVAGRFLKDPAKVSGTELIEQVMLHATTALQGDVIQHLQADGFHVESSAPEIFAGEQHLITHGSSNPPLAVALNGITLAFRFEFCLTGPLERKR